MVIGEYLCLHVYLFIDKLYSYGTDAAQSTALIAGTVRNVALVYIDMKGVGRKAIIKRVGKQYVKSKLGSK